MIPPAHELHPVPKVLFFLPGLNVGGAEWHTVTLRRELRERGIPSNLVIYGKRRSDVLLKQPGASDPVLLDAKGMSDLRGWIRIWRELRRANPDIIIAINQTPLIAAILVRLLGGVKSRIACIFHTTLLRPSEERRLFLFHWALRKTDMLVYVSGNQQVYWSQRGLCPRSETVILNGIDLDHFTPSADRRECERSRFGFAQDDIVFGMVAAFRPEKNHEDLVRALAQVRRKGLSAKLLLVGDGPTRSAAAELADQLGMTKHILFAGEQSDVRPFIEACDAGVLCSRAVETFSLSALEFLALGVPMIMSRIGGASEIVRHGENGLLYESGDLPALVSSMVLMADPASRAKMAERARPSLGALRLEAMVDNYQSLITELSPRRAA